MKKAYYHGSSTHIDGPLSEGSYVSSAKCNALIFARRRCQGNCYIYVVQVDPAVDLQQRVNAGTVDWVLARDIAFSERILVTDELIAECKVASEAAGLPEIDAN